MWLLCPACGARGWARLRPRQPNGPLTKAAVWDFVDCRWCKGTGLSHETEVQAWQRFIAGEPERLVRPQCL